MAYNPNNPNGQATMANSAPVTLASNQSTLPVSIATMPSTPVTGTFYQATQPVSMATMPSTPVANDVWGQQTSITNSSTVTVASIGSSPAGYQIKGFVAHGTGDGYWFITVAGTTVLSGRTRWSNPTLTVNLPNGISVTTASAVLLQVTNESGSTANYEGTLLGQ